nr:hypothetical protein [Tanacetum cinerariifolium]
MVGAGVAGAGMMSRVMMRMTVRMRTMVRRCWAVPKKLQTYPGRHVAGDKYNNKFIEGLSRVTCHRGK